MRLDFAFTTIISHSMHTRVNSLVNLFKYSHRNGHNAVKLQTSTKIKIKFVISIQFHYN